MGINNCCSIVQTLVGTSIGTDWKFEACFYCQNTRRVAPKFAWTLLYVLFSSNAPRSAMKKVGACFYPQNIRRAARKFLSAQGASPEQWVNTSVRVLCLKSIWRFDRQWERLQRVFTLRISGAPPESSFPLKARRPSSGWTLLYVLYLKSIWRFYWQWERLQRVFTLRTSGAPPESSFPFKARRPNSGRTLPYVLYSEIYLTPNNSIDVITIATIFQIIRIGGRSVMQTTRIFS